MSGPTSSGATSGAETAYEPVCRLLDIEVEGGVAALVGGASVAVFRSHLDTVHAIANYDPYSRAAVLARGIVGSQGERLFVASPMHKQRFDLSTGECLDDAAVRVPTYHVRLDQGVVLVGPVKESP